jgi:hypothetical protein
MKSAFPATAAFFAALTSQIWGAAFTDAKITHVVNEVRVFQQAKSRRADSGMIARRDSTIQTGAGSRAEMVFPEQTLVRLGADTTFRLQPGTRDLVLDRGTVLIDQERLRGTTRVLAGSLAATLDRGVVLIEHLPPRSLKIVVLDGEVRVGVNKFLGDSLVLKPGKLLIAAPDVRSIPDPVDVDLRRLVKTSALVGVAAFRGGATASVANLPSIAAIEKNIERQAAAFEKKTLYPTNLVILGSGTEVTIAGSGPAEVAQPPASQTPEMAPPGTVEPRLPESSVAAKKLEPWEIGQSDYNGHNLVR